MSDGGYFLKAGRVPEQVEQMKRLAAADLCIFCPDGFAAEHREPALPEFETAHWYTTTNDYPYPFTTLHLLIVSKKHVQRISDLPAEALQELMPLIAMIECQMGLESIGQIMRSGDFLFNGGSVDHLHVHVVVGDRQPNHKVRFKVASHPDDS